MSECKKLGTVKRGPACGCVNEDACVLDVQDGQWPYDPSIEDTLDVNPQNEQPLAGWTLVKPHGIKVHQRTFGVTAQESDLFTLDVIEEMWQAKKDDALERLLEDNGLKLTYDTFYDQIADQHMGRWTLEEVTT